MRLFLSLLALLTSTMVLLGQKELLSGPDNFVFRDKCTIEYVDQDFTLSDEFIGNNHESYSTVSKKNYHVEKPKDNIIEARLEDTRDSIPKTKRTKLRLDPTFELGMHDAKKYYRLRYHKVAQNPKNPNNLLLTQDPAYNSGYLWGIQKKHNKLHLVIMTFSIIIAVPLLFILFLSIAGTSGGWWL